VKLNAGKTPRAERRERVVVLQPSELGY
jgi:hypothetical protein